MRCSFVELIEACRWFYKRAAVLFYIQLKGKALQWGHIEGRSWKLYYFSGLVSPRFTQLELGLASIEKFSPLLKAWRW